MAFEKGHRDKRQEIFSKYGWKIIFLDETQVNETEIIKQLGEGD